MEWTRRNNEASRPFIDHQLEIVDFYVGLELGARVRADIRVIHADELISAFPERTRSTRNPLALRVTISREGKSHEIGIIPDLIFGIGFPDGSRRCFMVEIDRGTMPLHRSDLSQTSIERKMRGYLTAHSTKLHEQQFDWKTFRVLTVTTNNDRLQSMMEMLREFHLPQSLGQGLFFFSVRKELLASDPIRHSWLDGHGRQVKLI
jgi:hypothetical protein